MGTLLTTAGFNLVASDPRGFAGKVAERIRLADGPVSAFPTGWLRRFSEGQDSTAREVINAGHLSDGIRLIAEQGSNASSSDIHLAKRTLERIKQLKTVPSSTATKSVRGGEHRILHVLTNSKPFTNSGYTVRSHHVLQCQQEASIRVHAVTRLGYPVLVGKLPTSEVQVIDGITYQRLLPWRYPSSLAGREELSVRMIVKQARQMGATILHTTTDYTNALVVAEAARRLDIPWVYEIRGELEATWLSRQPKELQAEAEASEFYTLARAQETRCMNAANAVVALSEISKKQLMNRGIPAEKITVIPNAVDESLIGQVFDQKAIRREFHLDPHALIVGSVTAVVNYEGLDTLIEALKYLPEDAIVLIVGDGTARPELEQYAVDLGVDHRVRFVGKQPSADIWRWYAVLDVFVVPRKDTKVTRTVTPIKPLIAMALDIPVVASDLPALREVTGETALYAIPDDAVALARQIRTTAQNNQEGPTWAAQRTWQVNTRHYVAVYDGLGVATSG